MCLSFTSCVCAFFSDICVEKKKTLFSTFTWYLYTHIYFFCLLVILIQCCMKRQNMKKLFCGCVCVSVCALMQIKRNHMLRINWNWQKFDTRSWLTSSSCEDFLLICMQSTYVKLSHINNVNILTKSEMQCKIYITLNLVLSVWGNWMNSMTIKIVPNTKFYWSD
jgi:hypothetical protein